MTAFLIGWIVVGVIGLYWLGRKFRVAPFIDEE